MAQASRSSGRRSQALGSPTSSGSCNCHPLHPLVIITIIINIIGRACKKMDFGGQSTLDPLPCYDPFPTIVIIVFTITCHLSQFFLETLFSQVPSLSSDLEENHCYPVQSPDVFFLYFHESDEFIAVNRSSNPQDVQDHQE